MRQPRAGAFLSKTIGGYFPTMHILSGSDIGIGLESLTKMEEISRLVFGVLMKMRRREALERLTVGPPELLDFCTPSGESSA